MDQTESVPAGAFPVIMLPGAEADALIRGLERKLDVMRTQLAACRAGQDIGEAGIAEWSRLEVQKLRIEELESELNVALADRVELNKLRHAVIASKTEMERAKAAIQASQQENLSLSRALQEALQATSQPAEQISAPVSVAPEVPKLQAILDEMQRVCAVILTTHQDNLTLNRASAPEPEIAAASSIPSEMLRLQAMLESTSWRITAPLRAAGNFLKRLRAAIA